MGAGIILVLIFVGLPIGWLLYLFIFGAESDTQILDREGSSKTELIYQISENLKKNNGIDTLLRVRDLEIENHYPPLYCSRDNLLRYIKIFLFSNSDKKKRYHHSIMVYIMKNLNKANLDIPHYLHCKSILIPFLKDLFIYYSSGTRGDWVNNVFISCLYKFIEYNRGFYLDYNDPESNVFRLLRSVDDNYINTLYNNTSILQKDFKEYFYIDIDCLDSFKFKNVIQFLEIFNFCDFNHEYYYRVFLIKNVGGDMLSDHILHNYLNYNLKMSIDNDQVIEKCKLILLKIFKQKYQSSNSSFIVNFKRSYKELSMKFSIKEEYYRSCKMFKLVLKYDGFTNEFYI